MPTKREIGIVLSLSDWRLSPRGRWYARVRHNVLQLLIIAAAVAVAMAFLLGLANGLAHHGVTFSFSYLLDAAGIEISEGKTLAFRDGWLPELTDFSSTHSNAQALVTGLINTVKVSVLGIAFSTVLGILLALGSLSTNWVVRQLCFGVVEFVRNTSLLIQLVFWYFAVVLQFPPIAGAVKFYSLIISQQGLYLPWPALAEGASPAAATALICAVLLACAAVASKGWVRTTAISLAVLLGASAAAIGFPFVIDYPIANRFRASGGASVSPELVALLLALTVNSSAYLAEIIRGSIQATPKGQWEAAAALGLSRRHTLRDVILPQVFRVVLPSFGNQYISLAKNTAFGIAIGFPELFNVFGTISNQSGRMLEGIVIVMLAYLLLSWVISGIVNLLNKRLTAKGAVA